MYDLAILGSGPGGYVAALRAGQLGLKTVVVEKDGKFGGTCLHRGCIPTKVLLHAAYVYEHIKAARSLGIEISEPRLNWSQLQSHKDRIVKRLNGGVEYLLKKNKAEIRVGFGRLKSAREIEVEGKTPEILQARAILVATGSEPRSLPGLDIDGKRLITNNEALELSELPKSMLVIGAGAVGVEFASCFASFGVSLTLIELLPRILPLEDEEVSAELDKILRKRGIKIFTQSKVAAVAPGSNGLEATLEGKDGKTRQETFEKILVAVGRRPNTTGIGLEKTRAKLDRGYVETDGSFETAEPGLYAIGDITKAPQLAHVASAAGVLVAEKVAGHKVQPMDMNRIPGVTFSHPQVASIGLSEKAAMERGHKIRVGRFPFQALGKAMILGEPDGFVKIVADEKYGEILGIHILHAHAGDLIGEAVAAMNGEIPAADLARAIHPHPTLSEAIMEAAHGTFGTPLHT